MTRTVEVAEFLERRKELLAAIDQGDVCIQENGETIAWMISAKEWERLQGVLGEDAANALRSFRAAIQSVGGPNEQTDSAERGLGRRAS